MDNRVKIEGAEELLKALSQLDKGIDGVVKSAMRKAANPELAKIKQLYPKSIRKAVGIRFAKQKGKEQGILGIIGLSGSRSNPNKQWAFMKAYWMEWGTMANRSSQHKFTAARKPVYKNRKGGIKARRILDSQLPSAMANIKKNFERELPLAIEKKLQNAK